MVSEQSINRNILECKYLKQACAGSEVVAVLIETYWNVNIFTKNVRQRQ